MINQTPTTAELESFIFSGFVLGVIQKEFLPLIDHHGYRIEDTETVLDNGYNWKMKLDLGVKDKDHLLVKYQLNFKCNFKNRLLEVQSDSRNFKMSLEYAVKDEIPGLFLSERLVKIEKGLKSFFDDLVKNMLNDVKFIP